MYARKTVQKSPVEFGHGSAYTVPIPHGRIEIDDYNFTIHAVGDHWETLLQVLDIHAMDHTWFRQAQWDFGRKTLYAPSEYMRENIAERCWAKFLKAFPGWKLALSSQPKRVIAPPERCPRVVWIINGVKLPDLMKKWAGEPA